MASVDTDKEIVSERVDDVEKRWKYLEKKAEVTTKSLEDNSSKLAEQHDMLSELTRKVTECEEMLASQSALGPSAYDNKHIERVKVSPTTLHV